MVGTFSYWRRPLAAAALVGLLSALLVSAPAGAESNDSSADVILTSTLTVTDDVSGSPAVSPLGFSTGQPGVIVCSGTTHYPHYSGGAGGAIYKLTVTCSGSGYSSVSVRVVCGLYFSLSDGYYGTLRASDVYAQTVAVGGSRIFYCPRETVGHGGTGKGYWTALSSMQIVSPGIGTIDTERVTIYKDIHS